MAGIAHVLCLVGAHLSQPKIDSLVAGLAKRKLPITGSKWLSPRRALDLYLDIPLSLSTPGLVQDVRRALPSVDVAVLPRAHRRKRLLVADMDSTLVIGETIVDLAQLAGVAGEVDRLTSQAMRGRLDFAEALIDRVKLLKGLKVDQVIEVARSVALSPGALTLTRTMAASGARLVLISGGFTRVSAGIAARLGMDRHVANILAEAKGVLTGGLGLPLIDGAMKAQIAREERTELGLKPDQVVAVGDGANDVGMLGEAGLSVAYRGKPVLEAKANALIAHSDLTALLYFQGYEDQDFQTA